VEPLRTVLEEGWATGRLPDAEPDLDVRTVGAITAEVVLWAVAGVVKLSRTKPLITSWL
jgi:hypothetical protein